MFGATEFKLRAAAADESKMQVTSLEWAALTHGDGAETADGPTQLELLADSAGVGREALRELLRAKIARALTNQHPPP
jgi:hypothetical protein